MKQTVDTIGTFTAPELERAAGLPDRSVELLKRDGLMLGQVTEPARGRPARYDFRALSRMVCIGLLSEMAGGFVPAARIVNEIGPELEDRYGSFPCGLPDMQLLLADQDGTTEDIRRDDGELCPYRTIEKAWRRGIEDEKVKRPNDYVLLIINGNYVAQTVVRSLGLIEPKLVIRFGDRQRGLVCESLESEQGVREFNERYANSVSELRLNIGMALRRAVIAIVKQREAIGM